MPKFQGVIATLTGVTGDTSIIIGRTFGNVEPSRVFWGSAIFGISVTRVGVQPFSCYVVGFVQGVTVPIAGVSGIGSTSCSLLPLVNEVGIGIPAGTTQSASIGIIAPRKVVFGNSAVVGATYGAVVSAALSEFR